jgi:hypothetical protein
VKTITKSEDNRFGAALNTKLNVTLSKSFQDTTVCCFHRDCKGRVIGPEQGMIFDDIVGTARVKYGVGKVGDGGK